MSKTTFLKICGFTNPEIAYQAARLGCKFIGMIFCSSCRRHVPLTLAKEIADAVKRGGATPVITFVNSFASEIKQVCSETNISTVQLHGALSQYSNRHLPACIKRIYVHCVDRQPLQTPTAGAEITNLDQSRDFLLFDSKTPGMGISFDWNSFLPPNDFPWILAGGINLTNIREALHNFQPDGIDISSGAENDVGEKDINKIQRLVEAIHEYNSRA